MATSVKTDADTDTPCTKPLILHTLLEKGQPVEKMTNAQKSCSPDSGLTSVGIFLNICETLWGPVEILKSSSVDLNIVTD